MHPYITFLMPIRQARWLVGVCGTASGAESECAVALSIVSASSLQLVELSLHIGMSCLRACRRRSPKQVQAPL